VSGADVGRPVHHYDPGMDTTPSQTPRYRCTACGNLTRFEVTITRRTRAFHHYTIGGELSVEDTEVLAENIESVVCRWCGTASSVVEVDPSTVEEVAEAGSDPAGRIAGG
jgi:hypothetical protein